MKNILILISIALLSSCSPIICGSPEGTPPPTNNRYEVTIVNIDGSEIEKIRCHSYELKNKVFGQKKSYKLTYVKYDWGLMGGECGWHIRELYQYKEYPIANCKIRKL